MNPVVSNEALPETPTVALLWPQPRPLADTVRIPSFPSEALPPQLRGWVEGQARALQVPIELPAFQAMAAVSTCLAKRIAIEARPGWVEPLNTYWLVAMGSGERKSPVVRAATAPIHQHEREERERHQARLSELRSTDENDGAARAELKRLEAEGPPRLLVDDITAEALALVMAASGGRIGMLSAEGGVFDTMGGRYTNNVPNLDLMLKAHAGDHVRIDRKLSGQAIFIDEPALTVGLTVQPSLLQDLAGKPGFRGRGLLARFFFALPTSMVGSRAIEPAPVLPEVTSAYAATIASLLALPEPLEGPPLLRLSPEAHARMVRFQGDLEPRLGPFGDMGSMADWGGKLCGGIVRIAGLLHAVEHSGGSGNCGGGVVSLETLEAALRIGVYLVGHAKAAFALMGTDPRVTKAQHVLAWIAREYRDSFTHRGAQQALKGTFENVKELRETLDLLVDHDYLRRVEPPHSGRGRPPEPSYLVNPACHNSHNPQNTSEAVAA